MNPTQNYHRQIMNPELSNPETFVGTLYPKKFESSDKTSNSFRKEIELAPSYAFQMYCNHQTYIKIGKKNHKIRFVEPQFCFMYRQSLCEAVQCKRCGPEKQGIQIFLRIQKLLH